MLRTHACGELRTTHIGQKVKLCGWVNRVRDHGGVIFIDLRDRSGIVQTVFDPQRCPQQAHRIARKVGNEFVLLIEGDVVRRPEGTENPKLATGEIEVRGESIEILNTAKPTPFSVTSDEDADEILRLKHRYLDLRRKKMRDHLELRHRFTKAVRDFMDGEGFWEVETPILWKHTPEGAREYLVPARLYPGRFYVLPQSPQLCKQLLMVAGVEKYFQIARCFRDEDPRADRQPEFTQIDIEMSFVEMDDILSIVERLLQYAFEKAAGIKIEIPFRRIPYHEAIARFGSDKPDLRFGMELCDFSDILASTSFKGFKDALDAGGQVKGICAKGCAHFSRKDISDLTDLVKRFGAKGLATFALGESEIRSQVAKFLSEAELQAMFERSGCEAGDLLLVVADKPSIVSEALSRLRLELGRRLNLIEEKLRPEPVEGRLEFCWIVPRPLLEWSETEGRYTPLQHPFTMPFAEDISLLEQGVTEIQNPKSEIPKGHPDHPLAKVRAYTYDLVLNGYEIGGGSIRIHRRDLQQLVFQALELPLEEAYTKFEFLLEAFEYGAPPHGGIALGLDRILAILAGTESIRDVIAFPKTSTALDPLTGAPTQVGKEVVDELHIALTLPVEEEGVREEEKVQRDDKLNQLLQLYEKYGKPLEAEHWGEYVAISYNGEVIVSSDDIHVMQEGMKQFGRGNFVLCKVGLIAVDEWRGGSWSKAQTT